MLRLPATYADLTLRQIAILETNNDALTRVLACTDTSPEDVRKSPLHVLNDANEYLELLQNAETKRHPKIIELNGIEYGFIPDWDAFTTGEWIDLENYAADFWNNVTKVMSVLYRPIERRSGTIYTITPYTAKEDDTPFNELSAEIFAGAMLFFLDSRNELLNTTKLSLEAVATSLMSSVRNGDGIQYSTDLRARIFSKWTRSRNYLSELVFRTWRFLKT